MNFGTIVISKQQAIYAAKQYQAWVNNRPSPEERGMAQRIVHACEQHRMDAVELPMNSPLVDFIVPEIDGQLVRAR
jgi:hypothetical protein